MKPDFLLKVLNTGRYEIKRARLCSMQLSLHYMTIFTAYRDCANSLFILSVRKTHVSRNGNTGVQESPAFLYIHDIPDLLREELVECEYLFMYSHAN